MAVLEAQVAADTVERLFDGGQNAGEGRTVLILLVLPVVIIETQADRSVVAGTSWPGSLDGVAAFRVTLQIESLGKANVNIFRTTGGVSRVAPVDHGHRPVKVSVVGRPAEFDAALRRAKNNWIVCRCTRGSEVGLAVNVIRRQINRFRLREGQIQLELSEPHVQRVLRQSDPMAQIAVFQPTVAHGAAGIRGVYRNVVVDPEGKVLAETPSADDREGVGGEQVGTGSESSLGDEACGLLAVQCEVTLVPEGNGQKARNLARVHGAGKSFFLGFRAKENWGFLDEGFVIFRELEAVFLECFPEVVQFRIVVVAGSARGLVLPGERRNGRTLGSRRQYRREHNQGRNYRKETTVPRMVSHHNRSS